MRLEILSIASFICLTCFGHIATGNDRVAAVFQKVASHSFHPLNEDHSFTNDRKLGKHGIADLNDSDWKVRTLAIRDLLRELSTDAPAVRLGLEHESQHVRQIVAATLAIGGDQPSVEKLESLLEKDPSSLVRAQAAMSLGQLVSGSSVELLTKRFAADTSKDVRHQCELALDQIAKNAEVTQAGRQAFETLNEDEFEKLVVDSPAQPFSLTATDGESWTLRDQRGKWVVLIWIFADWCPVCHTEFNDLIGMKGDFAAANTTVATIECHDLYRCRLMVGKEVDAKYWFAKESFQQKYKKGIWWPHLSDPAGKIGATYGVDPMAFAVHAEYVNRPSTIIIDPKGVVRFAYYGTFWGDRPSIHETLEMIRSEKFEFSHPGRLESKVGRK